MCGGDQSLHGPNLIGKVVYDLLIVQRMIHGCAMHTI